MLAFPNRDGLLPAARASYGQPKRERASDVFASRTAVREFLFQGDSAGSLRIVLNLPRTPGDCGLPHSVPQQAGRHCWGFVPVRRRFSGTFPALGVPPRSRRSEQQQPVPPVSPACQVHSQAPIGGSAYLNQRATEFARRAGTQRRSTAETPYSGGQPHGTQIRNAAVQSPEGHRVGDTAPERHELTQNPIDRLHDSRPRPKTCRVAPEARATCPAPTSLPSTATLHSLFGESPLSRRPRL